MMFNINGLVRNYATVQDATRTISVKPAIRDAADAGAMPRAKGDIRFENVSFHYGKGGGVIDNLDPAHQAGRARRAGRPVGRRQDHDRQSGAAAVRRREAAAS